jgi:hypothetical protein
MSHNIRTPKEIIRLIQEEAVAAPGPWPRDLAAALTTITAMTPG